MKKLIAFLILALVVQGTAHAQLGGLLNKAKDAVKKEATKVTEKKATETKEKVESKATETATAVTTSTSNANATDIDPNLGLSMSQLRESYNKLSHEAYLTIYRNTPYCFYVNSWKETAEYFNMMRYLIVNMMVSGNDSPTLLFKKYGDAYALPAEMIINANFAVFKAFPKESYPLFLEARTLLRNWENGRIASDHEKINTLVMETSEDGTGFGFRYSENKKYGRGVDDPFMISAYTGEKKSERLPRWKAEEARLLKLYRENVPFENVKNTFINTLTQTAQYSKEKNWLFGVYNSYQLEVAAEDMKNHPKKVEDNDYTQALAMYENLAANNYPKWEAHLKSEWMKELEDIYSQIGDGKSEIPKAGKSDPKLEAEMIAIAKTLYEDGRVPVKAIIKGADWSYDRNAFGQIINRYHTGYIIFKMKDGTHRMVDIGFKQMYNGGSYGRLQLRGVGTSNLEVDY